MATVFTQVLYTVLYIAKIDVPRQLIWGIEGLLFTFLAMFAGTALVQAKNDQVGWSAITFSAIFNVLQVCIGAVRRNEVGYDSCI